MLGALRLTFRGRTRPAGPTGRLFAVLRTLRFTFFRALRGAVREVVEIEAGDVVSG